MWNKDQMRDHIIDQIIKIILKNRYATPGYFFNSDWQLDLAEYRKTVNTSGYIETGEAIDNEKQIIYQEDYQNPSIEIEEFVQWHLDCFTEFNGSDIVTNEYGEKMYTIPAQDWVDNQIWMLVYGSFSTNNCVEVNEGDGTCTDEYNNELYGTIALNDTAYIESTFTCNGGGGAQQVTLKIHTPASAEYSLATGTPVLDLLSQVVPLDSNKTEIHSGKADTVLDTTIYELLPGIQTRQERIDKFFSEYAALKPQQYPNFDADQIEGVDWQYWDVGNNIGPESNTWSETYDISDPLNSTNGYITRLVRHENPDTNLNKSLEWLRNDINFFLEDIDTVIDPDLEDERIDYKDISEGYLKLRGLNQSMIIRAETNDTTGLENYTTDGFTIAMWVRFIDKKSGGTLFNYGNPLGNGSSHGFMLETFSVGKDDVPSFGSSTDFNTSHNYLFTESSHARFVRLVVNVDGAIYNSHMGGINPNGTQVERLTGNILPQVYQKTIGGDDDSGTYINQAFTYTQIPVDRNEWYFIVANFKPSVDENAFSPGNCSYVADGDCDGSQCNPECVPVQYDPDYWRWNVTPGDTVPGTYENQTNLGAKCKVEIISKSDLLRARGYLT